MPLVAKEIKLTTLPNIHLHNQFRGTRKTRDGHYLVCFKGEGKIVELEGTGKVVREIEVTRDKKVVWQFEDHAHFKTINQIQVLDVAGDVTRGKILR